MVSHMLDHPQGQECHQSKRSEAIVTIHPDMSNQITAYVRYGEIGRPQSILWPCGGEGVQPAHEAAASHSVPASVPKYFSVTYRHPLP